MIDHQALRQLLLARNGQGYRAYKRLGPAYRFPGFRLVGDHGQNDPCGDTSRLRVVVPPAVAGLLASERFPLPASLDPRRGRRQVEVKTLGRGRVRFGEEEIELSAVEQLVEAAQSRAIARALAGGGGGASTARAVRPALQCVMQALGAGGLDALDHRVVGGYAEFRTFEPAAALGRIRSLRVRPARAAQPSSASSPFRSSSMSALSFSSPAA